MKQFICILICTAFVLSSCNRNDKNQLERIVVDGTESVKFSTLFSDVSIIVPQTNDSSMFGLEIRRMEMHQGKLFLLNINQSGKSILCFNTNGDFLYSIDRMGSGPGEYTFFGDYFIDREKNYLIIIGERNKWFYFDLDGNYLYSDEERNDFIPHYINELNDSLYFVYTDCGGNNCNDILLIDRNNRTIKYPICCGSLWGDYSPALPMSQSNGNAYFYCGNDTLYDISSQLGKINPVFYLYFGDKHRAFKNKSVNLDDEEKMSQFLKEFRENGLRITTSFVANDDYFAFSYGESLAGVLYGVMYNNIFYNIKSKKSYNSNNIDFDIFNINTRLDMSLLGCYEGYFYAVINNKFSNEEINAIKNSAFLNETTREKLMEFDDMSNSLLLKFR